MTNANLSIKVSFASPLAPLSELHRSRKIFSQQPSKRAAQQTCGVQLDPVRTPPKRTFTNNVTLNQKSQEGKARKSLNERIAKVK